MGLQHKKEICFAYNEDTLTIVDVTTKPGVMVSRIGYDNVQYSHQVRVTSQLCHGMTSLSSEMLTLS